MADQVLYDLKNVPIFAVGKWNGDDYAEADLDRMVAAYGVVGFQPPLKLGHDESQPLAKNDGMPALGWVENLRRTGKTLYADLRALPKRVYDAIRRKAYDRVSAEVYWDYVGAGGQKHPRVLKALALLGADVPAVTSLASLESLYDASGKPFKRYDFGPMPIVAVDAGQASPTEMECQKKCKADVNYRTGGADDDGDGLADRCGSCQFFQGPADVAGTAFAVSSCSLVDGDVGSTMLCDLYDAMDAFSPASAGSESDMAKGAVAKTYIIEKRGDKWVLISKSDGKVLGTHPTEEAAKKQEAAIEISKHDHANPNHKPAGSPEGGQFAPAGGGTIDVGSYAKVLKTAGWALDVTGATPDAQPIFVNSQLGDGDHEISVKSSGAWEHTDANGVIAKGKDLASLTNHLRTARTFTLSADAVKALCPGCADRMAFLNLKELRLTYDPTTKVYTGFSQGLCDRFGDAAGFRTRCMDDQGKLSESVDDLGAFCNALKEYCFGSVTAGDEKTHKQGSTSKTSSAPAPARGTAAAMNDARTARTGRGGVRTMALQVVEEGGQFCVGEGGDKKCFATRAEAEAMMADMKGAMMSEEKEAHNAVVKSLQVQIEELSGKLRTYEAQVVEKDALLASIETQKRKDANAAWIKTHTAEGSLRLFPTEVKGFEFLLDQLSELEAAGASGLKTYAAEDGKPLKPSMVLKQLIEARKPNTLLYEEVSAGHATETARLEGEAVEITSYTQAREVAVARAKKYMQDKGEKVFSVAYNAVLAADPNLKRAVAGVTPEGEQKAAEGSEQMAMFFKR